MTLFIPPNNIDNNEPVVFLAGPIQGARDWQADAVRYIDDLDPMIQIASPRRPIAPKGEFSD